MSPNANSQTYLNQVHIMDLGVSSPEEVASDFALPQTIEF